MCPSFLLYKSQGLISGIIPFAFYNFGFLKKVFFLRIAMTIKMLYNKNVKQFW